MSVGDRTFRDELVGSMSQGADGSPTVAVIEAAFAHHGLRWRNVNMEVAPDDLGDAVRGARALGFRGFNLSIPHKVVVIEHLDGLGPSAHVIGAVNCVVPAAASSSARTPTVPGSSPRCVRWSTQRDSGSCSSAPAALLAPSPWSWRSPVPAT